MAIHPDLDRHSFFGRSLYVYLAALAGIPLFLVINAYVRAIDVHEDEVVSTAATVCFLLGIFSGRYLIQFWAERQAKAPVFILVSLSTLIVACISWLFFHADFPLKNHIALNLLAFWIPFAICSVCIGITLKILRTITQNELREAQASAAISKSELHLLQSQLSPHFLFNTLNNLYGLSISDHEKLPPLLLRLSELLRYSVYEANETFVPLKDELAYLNNYIEFEKIRIGERLNLVMEIEPVADGSIKIAPMLLIVFIENAFKHAKNTADERIFVEIKLKTFGNAILFSVINSFAMVRQSNAVSKSSGFGLVSVRKRLDLLYPSQHQLTIEEESNQYSVLLQVHKKK